MTPVYITVAVIVALFMGAMLMLAGFFCWYLLKTMKEVRSTVEGFVKVLDPLVKTGALQQISSSAAGILKIGRRIVELIPDVNNTFRIFNNTLLSKTTQTPFSERSPESPPVDEAAPMKISYDEEKMADLEHAEKLRRQGIETDAARVVEPGTEGMTGAEV